MFGAARKGRLAEGYDADLTIVESQVTGNAAYVEGGSFPGFGGENVTTFGGDVIGALMGREAKGEHR